MADNDRTVTIPGITGSTLRRNGAEVWSSAPRTLLTALATLGRHIHELELPGGIGDDAPDDGVEATALDAQPARRSRLVVADPRLRKAG